MQLAPSPLHDTYLQPEDMDDIVPADSADANAKLGFNNTTGRANRPGCGDHGQW